MKLDSVIVALIDVLIVLFVWMSWAAQGRYDKFEKRSGPYGKH